MHEEPKHEYTLLRICSSCGVLRCKNSNGWSNLPRLRTAQTSTTTLTRGKTSVSASCAPELPGRAPILKFDHEQASATDAQARVLDRQDARKYRVVVRQQCQSCVFSGKCLSLTVLLLSSTVLLCVVVFVLWALRCAGRTEREKSQRHAE